MLWPKPGREGSIAGAQAQVFLLQLPGSSGRPGALVTENHSTAV